MNLKLKELPLSVWILPSVLLLAALMFRFPYGFYMLLRLVVCSASVGLGVLGWKESPRLKNISIVLFAQALLYNPVIPVHLEREVWIWCNAISIGVFGLHWFWALRKN